MSRLRLALALTLTASAVLFSAPALAIINQVDGTIVPVSTRLQSCLDKATTAMPVGGDGPGVLDAVRLAAIRPQTFLPNPGGANPYIVTFYDVGEGGGYRNRFGWYPVGTSPFVAANRHELFDCRAAAAACDCPCNGGARSANGPTNSCTTWVNSNTVRVDFNCLRALGASNANYWNGGPIAFYLMTPELLDGTGSSPNSCAPVDSTANRIYSTDNTVNDDGNYVHFLIYESRTYAQSYYFGFEDLFRGGDNDFEDTLVRANGLVPSCNPSPEVCDGMDNNCDGVVDNFTRPCSTACGAGTQTCAAGSWGACTARTPGTEVCNGVDDNCDGEVDEGLTMACTGTCGAGLRYCVSGAFGECVTSRTPTAETCNNVDDNCNGMVDEGLTMPCSTVCGAGLQTCSAGAWGACTAPVPSAEVCDGLDNNCNGLVDDGIAPRPCSSVCGPGTATCQGGTFVCNAPLPQTEVCNNLDDDCNGMVDDNVPPGGSCGRGVGACMAGMFVCEAGTYVCRGATSGTAETCNNVDDDCDGVIDNGVPPGGPCNTAPDGAHLCDPGQLHCRAGAMVCEGGRRGTAEVCDCMDNDCDGVVDNTDGGGLCPGGGACIACSCRTPCRPDAEFPCSSGLVCRDNFCVPPTCGGRMCQDGEVCSNNACVDPCTLITCNTGQTCQRGRCVENSCYVLGCPTPGQVCIDNACVPNPCANVHCGANEFCRDGTCVGSCGGVSCPVGQSCRDGACVADPCDGVHCDSGRVCVAPAGPDAGAGTCQPDPCTNVGCGAGRRCDQGHCVDDPCVRIQCPGGADVLCRAGQCQPRNPVPHFVRDRGIGTGGGGFSCAARPGPVGRADGSAALALLGLAVASLAVRRRRGARAARALARVRVRDAVGVAVLAAAGAGCHNEPYCFNCGDAVALDAVVADNPPVVDAPPNDACVPGAQEQCNGVDDNCNGQVDEGFDLQTDPANCGACGMRCDLVHALPACMDGTCRVGQCDVGWYDLDHNPLNGCEYGCTPTGDEVCDGVDNNCDGQVDEGIDLQTDRSNCGRCGNACRFDHASASCVAGACQMGACDDGFVDRDHDATDGCEYGCVASGAEVCDGRDNDCNGTVDDGFDTMTDPMNCGACGRACVVPHGMAGCAGGTCTVVSCATGFADDPRSPGMDCALACGDASGVRGPEVCDGRDNDCNGLIDDGTVAGVGDACGATDTGDCARGRNQCDHGVLRCVGEVGPSSEICDGRDNDCNGAVDDGALPGVGPGTHCGTDVGACSYGSFACVSGAIVCSGGTASATEVCNGVDDNCNGQVDEGLTAPTTRCTTGSQSDTAGVCRMLTRSCGGAAGWQCNFPPTYRNLANEALCDGLDNNCDGRVDEGCLALGTEARLDQGTGNSIQPIITGASAAGTTLGVAYLDRRNNNADIFFNRSTNNGTSWGTDFAITHDSTNADQVEPWLAGSGNDFFAAWGDFRGGTNHRAVYENTSTNLGAAWGTTDVNAASTTTDAFNIQLVANGNEVTAVFEALFSDRSRHIDVAESHDAGATWPVFVRVDHAPSAAVCSTPSVAVGAAGTVYVAWRDNRNGATDIYFNRSADNGATWLAADVRMDTDAAGAHQSSAPSVAADASNHVYVVWQDNQTPPSTRFDIYSRASSNGGTSFNAANVRVDADPLAHDSHDPVALSVQGAFAAVWLDDRLGRTSVYASRSEDNGATWPSSDVRIQTNTAGVSNALSLSAATSNGVVFAVWADDRDPMGSLDIYANYSLDGGRLFQPADVRVDGAAAGRDSETPFAYSVGGVGHFVWVDRRADGVTGDIYYRSLH